jgi:hypothetical protein
VLAVAGALRDLILQDGDLVQQVVAAAERQSAAGDKELPGKIAEAERAIATLSSRYKDLMDMCGVGTDQDRAETKSKMAATLQERANRQTQLGQFREMIGKSRKVITPEEVKVTLERFVELFQKAAAGELGDDLRYEAAEDFRSLVGGKIEVHFDRRAGRKRPVARGVFIPAIVEATCEKLGLADGDDAATKAAVEVWLRPPPRVDAMADQVRRMYEVEGLGFRKIGEVLGCGSGNACLAYKRAYETLGLPLPPRRTNLGRPRKVG